jgi:hypothetical protein
MPKNHWLLQKGYYWYRLDADMDRTAFLSALHHACLLWVFVYVTCHMCCTSLVLASTYIVGLALTIKLIRTYWHQLDTLSFILVTHTFTIVMQVVAYQWDGSLNSFLGYSLGTLLCKERKIADNTTIGYHVKLSQEILRGYIQQYFLCYFIIYSVLEV